jgi:molybdopterin-guanine dinucleotide biosynthesis protein A
LNADKLKIAGFYKEVRLLSIPEEKIKPFNKDGRLFLNINTPENLKDHQ